MKWFTKKHVDEKMAQRLSEVQYENIKLRGIIQNLRKTMRENTQKANEYKHLLCAVVTNGQQFAHVTIQDEALLNHTDYSIEITKRTDVQETTIFIMRTQL